MPRRIEEKGRNTIMGHGVMSPDLFSGNPTCKFGFMSLTICAAIVLMRHSICKGSQTDTEGRLVENDTVSDKCWENIQWRA